MSIGMRILSQFFTKEELADELGRNMRTLDRWDVLGIGPPRTLVGRKILYRRVSVERWLASQERDSGSNGEAWAQRAKVDAAADSIHARARWKPRSARASR
jgi:hypothetical protein